MKRILIVEDDETLATMLKDCLEVDGHICKVTYNGQEAYNLLKNEKFDLIISDNQMPVMTGCSLNKKLFSSPEFNTPFILCSGDVDLRDESRRKDLVLLDFIPKPIDFDLLEQHINNIN